MPPAWPAGVEAKCAGTDGLRTGLVLHREADIDEVVGERLPSSRYDRSDRRIPLPLLRLGSLRVGFPSTGRTFDLEPSRFESFLGMAVPAVDVTEDETAFEITVDLPGTSEKDIEINVADDMVVLKGEKRQKRQENEEKRYVSERSGSIFSAASPITAAAPRVASARAVTAKEFGAASLRGSSSTPSRTTSCIPTSSPSSSRNSTPR
jgi:HSP20 family molecular chaperone IbpA